MENGNFTNGPENFSNNNNGYDGAENYGAGNYSGNYDPAYAAPAEAPAEPPKKKKKGCLIAAIVVIVVGIILGIVGVVLAVVFGFIFLGGDKGVNNEEYYETTAAYEETVPDASEDSDYDWDYDWDNDNDYDWYSDDDYIDMIKDAKNSTYGITYGDAFESFFTDPEWSYFESTDDEDVVEFEGGLLYNNEPVTALIQFVLDVDAGTFEIYYLSFDGETQDDIMLSALIEKVFEEY